MSEPAAAAAAPSMAPGEPSLEETRLAQVRGTAPRAREHVSEGAQGQEPLHRKQQQQQPRSGGAFRSEQNVTAVPAPEEMPPDADNFQEGSRSAPESGVRSPGQLREGEER